MLSRVREVEVQIPNRNALSQVCFRAVAKSKSERNSARRSKLADGVVQVFLNSPTAERNSGRPKQTCARAVRRCASVVELANGGGNQQLGQIQLARFINGAGLEALGQNLFRETTSSGAPIVLVPGEQGAGEIAQGMLEASNVNVVEELVNMIETQRAYEINSKAISSVDSMLRFLNQNL